MGLFKSKDEKADEYFKRGGECSDRGDYNGAVSNYAKAIDYYLKVNKTIGLAASCYNLAAACKKLERWADARKYYEYSSHYYAQLGADHTEDLGDCYFYMGYCDAEANNYAAALEGYIKAIPLYQQVEALPDLANTYYNSGNATKNLGRNSQAIDYYTKARELYVRLGRNDDVKDCDKMLSKLGASSSSTSSFVSSAPSGESDEDMASKYFNIAFEANKNGDYYTGIENYEKSLPYYERMGNKKFIANVYYNLSITYQKVDNSNKAYENAEKAARLYSEIGDRENEGDCYDTMASALRKMGNSREAVRYQSMAVRIYEDLGKRDGSLASYYFNLGNELGDLEEHSTAVEAYKKGAEIYASIGRAGDEADCYYNICNRLDDIKRYDEALSFGERAVAIYQRIGQEDDIASCYINMAVACAHASYTSKATDYLKKSRAIYVRLGNTAQVAKIDDILN